MAAGGENAVKLKLGFVTHCSTRKGIIRPLVLSSTLSSSYLLLRSPCYFLVPSNPFLIKCSGRIGGSASFGESPLAGEFKLVEHAGLGSIGSTVSHYIYRSVVGRCIFFCRAYV